MNDPGLPEAVVLFGHGSRDPLWHGPILEVARRVQAQARSVSVRCAYLELTQPDLPTVVTELALSGVRKITVVPMFLGVGKHAREDLPQMLQTIAGQYPDIHFNLQIAVGEDPRLLDMLAQIALT